MKRKAILLGLVIVLLLSQVNILSARAAFAFMNGNSYLELDECLRIGYVGGLIDMTCESYQDNLPGIYKDLFKTIEYMQLGQIVKIFDKYLEDHPEKLHYSAADIFTQAIFDMLYM